MIFDFNTKTFFLTFIGVIQVFQPNRKSLLGFDNKFLEKFYAMD